MEVNDADILGCNMVVALLTISCDALGEQCAEDGAVFISEDDFLCDLATCVFLRRFKCTKNGVGVVLLFV